MPMKAIAIDDEPIALDIICSHASKVPYLQIEGVFTDAFKALDYLQRENVDLVFLDIKMPDISGIEFFNSLHKKPLLIFTTAYAEHAATGFQMDAVDYLLKPFSLARFLQACHKANELFNMRTSTPAADHLYIKTGYEQVKVWYEDILYLEAAGNYVTFVLKDRVILSRITFGEIETILPSNKFVRVHRSYAVAIEKVDKIGKTELTINKKTIPVSEAYSQNLSLITGKAKNS
jgi:two-component system, LytTR family, response regulator